MDLSTIKRKLDTGQYQEPWQYVEDIWLMFNNAWLYNRKTSRVYKYCSKLAEVFESEIDPVMQGLGYCCGRKVRRVYKQCNSHGFLSNMPDMNSFLSTCYSLSFHPKLYAAMENSYAPSNVTLLILATRTGTCCGHIGAQAHSDHRPVTHRQY